MENMTKITANRRSISITLRIFSTVRVSFSDVYFLLNMACNLKLFMLQLSLESLIFTEL